jgi:hypothetical protein
MQYLEDIITELDTSEGLLVDTEAAARNRDNIERMRQAEAEQRANNKIQEVKG